MEYQYLISTMTWSFSRLSAYEDCPYKFFLSYIMREDTDVRHFFSDYGTFMHSIIEKFLTGKLSRDELTDYYLLNFRKEVVGRVPFPSVFEKYFSQGLTYLKHIQPPQGNILGVEKDVEFSIGDREFIGFIDLLLERDGEIIVVDNKSRALTPRTGRTKPTKSDKELDAYLRQLYLYSVAVERIFDKLPTHLSFNCFRTETVITEPFDLNAFRAAKQWALDLIEKIEKETEWTPNIEEFKCKNLCDQCTRCEYFQMFRR